jgi:hypothetical protein
MGAVRFSLCAMCKFTHTDIAHAFPQYVYINVLLCGVVILVQLFDRCGLFTVGSDNREIDVFLDRECLQDGKSFQNEFVGALKMSSVVVPIVSSDALSRMCSASVEDEDNVLVEVRIFENMILLLFVITCVLML